MTPRYLPCMLSNVGFRECITTRFKDWLGFFLCVCHNGFCVMIQGDAIDLRLPELAS